MPHNCLLAYRGCAWSRFSAENSFSICTNIFPLTERFYKFLRLKLGSVPILWTLLAYDKLYLCFDLGATSNDGWHVLQMGVLQSPLYFFAASPLLAPFSESAPFVHIALELSTAHPWVQYICILEFRDAFGIYITNIPSGIKDEVKQSIQLSQPARDT